MIERGIEIRSVQNAPNPPEAFLAYLQERASAEGFFEPKRSAWIKYMADPNRARAILSVALRRTRLKIERGDHALDIGCGYGNLVLAMADAFTFVSAIDMDFERVLWCSRRCPKASVAYGSAANLPWPSNAFSLVTCIDVLQHLDYRQQSAAVREIVRVLKPGGRAMVCVPNRFQLFDEHNYLWFGSWLPHPIREIYSNLAHGQYVRCWERKGSGWRKLFENAGAEVVCGCVRSSRFAPCSRFNLYIRKFAPPMGRPMQI